MNYRVKSRSKTTSFGNSRGSSSVHSARIGEDIKKDLVIDEKPTLCLSQRVEMTGEGVKRMIRAPNKFLLFD